MFSLYQALQALPWHLIAAIGRQHQLTFDSNLAKKEVINRVQGHLLDSAYLANLWPQLSQECQHLLSDLLSAGGSLPAPHLHLRYGGRRPHRALLAAFRHQHPLSIIEQLALLGLIFWDQPSNLIYIPLDLQPLLPQPQAAPAPALPPGGGDAPAELLVHDLAVLLGLLQREGIRPLHRRWLPPNFLKSWGRHCRVAPVFPEARSELQTGRRRFIHYLAESAGLVAGSESTRLIPTPAAWLWLEATPEDRWQRLWERWNRPGLALWQQYRLPGFTWLTEPAALLGPLHQALPLLDPAQPQAFAETLLRRQPDLPLLLPPTLMDRLTLMEEIIVQLLAGPLLWLGILQKDEAVPDSSFRLHLSAHGLAILTGRSLPAPPPPARFALTADIQPDPLKSSLTLTLKPGLPDPADLAVALETHDEGFVSFSDSSFIISPASFVRALHRGWPAVALVAALNRLAERPLNSPELALLRAWTGAAERMVLHQGTVLEVNDPAILTRLASTRRGYELIYRTLSPRAVWVDPAKLDLLIRRLTEQEGTPPKVEVRTMNDESVPDSSFIVHHSSVLLLALKVYQALGQHISLPARIPQELWDQVRAAAGDEALATAEVAAGRTLAALRRALDGRTAFPPWPEESLPVEESLPAIEEALARGQTLELLYYAAGTDRVTRRTVEPYRVEWHGETPYLIGFCQQAEAERMFRLDRIREIA